MFTHWDVNSKRTGTLYLQIWKKYLSYGRSSTSICGRNEYVDAWRVVLHHPLMLCPLPELSKYIGWLLMRYRSSPKLMTCRNRHLLLLTGLRLSWAVLLTWVRFGWSWFGLHGSVVSWQIGQGLLGLGRPHSEVWQLFGCQRE